MADHLIRSMTCPACGKAAHVVLSVEPGDGDDTQRITVEKYSCPKHDFTTEAAVLRTLGYA